MILFLQVCWKTSDSSIESIFIWRKGKCYNFYVCVIALYPPAPKILTFDQRYFSGETFLHRSRPPIFTHHTPIQLCRGCKVPTLKSNQCFPSSFPSPLEHQLCTDYSEVPRSSSGCLLVFETLGLSFLIFSPFPAAKEKAMFILFVKFNEQKEEWGRLWLSWCKIYW